MPVRCLHSMGSSLSSTTEYEVHVASLIKRHLLAFIVSDAGMNTIEYGVLAASIGVIGFAVWQSITGDIGTAYGNWDAGTQGLWEPPDPGAGP